MYKLACSLILVFVFFSSYAKNIAADFTKINLPYVGIEMKLPTVFFKEKYDYIRTKDDKYMATIVFINKGRETLIKNINKEQSFIKNLLSNDSSIKENHTSYRYSYTRVFKYGTDGFVMASFGIDKELSKSKIDKYIELSKNALNSISYSEENIDFMAELPFKIGSVKEGELSYRAGDTISFQKNGVEKTGTSISYKKKGSKPWADDYPLDFSYMKDECDKKIVTNEPARMVAGVKARVEKTSQSCQRGKYYISKKSTAIKYETSFVLDDYEIVATYLNKEGKEQGGWAFYQYVLDKVKSKSGYSNNNTEAEEQLATRKKTTPPVVVQPIVAKITSINEVSESAKKAHLSGKEVYDTVCFACHAKGVADSPILGDKADWTARIATGKESLYDSALHGKRIMPPKGGSMSLSDEEVKAAVDYMIGKL